ncbi:ATP-binding protein [Burkholderia cepacia]|uniref:ATP-dependent nuclease n=1 Tax=Burkholderia cepacia TaxID=292 RepID=UPI002FDF8486
MTIFYNSAIFATVRTASDVFCDASIGKLCVVAKTKKHKSGTVLRPKMIETFKLKFGKSSEATAESIAASPVNVFVGPNNSGKSKLLSEMAEFCRIGITDNKAVILDNLTFAAFDEAAIKVALERIRRPDEPGRETPPGHIFVGRGRVGNPLPVASYRQYMKAPNDHVSTYCQWFQVHDTLSLSGVNRINLVSDQAGGDLQRPPETSFQILFRDEAKYHEVRRIVFEAFGNYLLIDPTDLGKLKIRLADEPPRDVMEERGLVPQGVAYHAKARYIGDASDGVKAFTGIVIATIAGNPSVILIDEPEAFLHPSVAFKLGHEVSRGALTQGKKVFAATHSASFLMGCIQSGARVNIVRLTYRSGTASARVLDGESLVRLMRHPLLRSTGVLNALFYEFVVVTESDADRAFYQEINERLLEFKPEWAIGNALFINAQNKQTIPTILRPLRQLGIPAVGIVDIDALKEGGAVWANLLDVAGIPTISRDGLASMRHSVKAALDKSGKNMKRDGGINILESDDRRAAHMLLDQLSEHGIFIVPGGELESWLKHLEVSGHGPNWLTSIFEKLGADPTSENYVRPCESDVWAFLSKVRGWLVDASRKGIPD